jgi:RNA polymerase sigma-70 factor (ECF subfamily)
MNEFDRERLYKALSGDSASVRALVALLTPVVRARVLRALARRYPNSERDMATDVADFTQEVFVALFTADSKALRAWDPERGLSLRNYVGLLAQHRVAEILRKLSWQRQADETEFDESSLRATFQEPASDVEASSSSQEQLRRLLEHLEAKLSTRGLEMFERLYVQGQSIEQVCAETGLSADAVYQWRSRLSKFARDAHRAMQSQSGATDSMVPPAASRGLRRQR